jgi:hypothetical protein
VGAGDPRRADPGTEVTRRLSAVTDLFALPSGTPVFRVAPGAKSAVEGTPMHSLSESTTVAPPTCACATTRAVTGSGMSCRSARGAPGGSSSRTSGLSL